MGPAKKTVSFANGMSLLGLHRVAGRKVFFFEKKKQKTFGRCRGPVPSTYLNT
jgi:hypothetical protein